jgi:hypothetical protein
MLKFRTKITDETKRVRKRAKAASITNLGHAGRYIRGMAMRSIKVSPEPSQPGKPPRTRKGRLKRAIIYAVERPRQKVLVGPSRTDIGRIGQTHEFGGTEPPKRGRKANFQLTIGGHGPIAIRSSKPVVARLRTARMVAKARSLARTLEATQGTGRRRYPARPFMGPSLERSRKRLPAFWANSIRR